MSEKMNDTLTVKIKDSKEVRGKGAGKGVLR